jgi:hypothetical protein
MLPGFWYIYSYSVNPSRHNGGFVEDIGLFFRTGALSKVYYTLRDFVQEVQHVHSSFVRLFRNHVHVTSPSRLSIFWLRIELFNHPIRPNFLGHEPWVLKKIFKECLFLVCVCVCVYVYVCVQASFVLSRYWKRIVASPTVYHHPPLVLISCCTLYFAVTLSKTRISYRNYIPVAGLSVDTVYSEWTSSFYFKRSRTKVILEFTVGYSQFIHIYEEKMGEINSDFEWKWWKRDTYFDCK